MKANGLRIITMLLIIVLLIRCNTDENVSTSVDTAEATEAIEVAQTSAQLASGTSFTINGTSVDSLGRPHHGKRGGHGHDGKHERHPNILDGVSLLAPTDELLTIIDAETASDFRGFRISKNGGAEITHFNANGEEVALPLPSRGGPGGCSFSGNEHPGYDSILSSIVKTEIDFGSGVTFKRDTVEITRSGKIVITRTETENGFTEVTTFENYIVNDAQISGTKTRVNSYDSATNTGTSTTSVADGKIVFADGAEATWSSEKVRTSQIVVDDSGRPESGTIATEVNTSVVVSDGTVIYSHRTATPLTQNLACEGRRQGPVSGILETIYRDNTVSVNFGDGSCENRTITITVNGVTTTKTIGG